MTSMKPSASSNPNEAQITNFILNIIDEDLRNGKHKGQVITRFPPEPNGYLHVGHAKSICLNFGIAENYAGAQCNLRFDDTNPETEEVEFMESIKKDIEWLGFQWSGDIHHASDYFDKLYDFAEELIKMDKAYVCSLSGDEIRALRGTLTEGGKPSPYRSRTIDENLDLFRRMKAGEFEEGAHVLRAKIDMASGNINMRDPVLYRIRKTHHLRTGDKWKIYPMYDYTHCISDALEGITHSICTLEFEDHRPLYDWFLDVLKTPCHPQQIEFARLNLNYTITSKRKLKKLVEENHVNGWDDPRMPTISGMRRRGYTPNGIRHFCKRIGVSKKDTVIDMSILEDCVRDDLNTNALRAMAVIDPIRITLVNYPDDRVESLTVPNHPQRPEMGTRAMSFSKHLYIEAEDFMDEATKDFFRLAPGKEVRLRYAYVIKCEEAIKDPVTGRVTELLCSVDFNTLGKNPEGRKVKGIIHWVDANHCAPMEVRLYDRLFTEADPNASEREGGSFLDSINPHSLNIKTNCFGEMSLTKTNSGQSYQFERLGYFSTDPDTRSERLVFNRSVSLRSSI